MSGSCPLQHVYAAEVSNLLVMLRWQTVRMGASGGGFQGKRFLPEKAPRQYLQKGVLKGRLNGKGSRPGAGVCMELLLVVLHCHNETSRIPGVHTCHPAFVVWIQISPFCRLVLGMHKAPKPPCCTPYSHMHQLPTVFTCTLTPFEHLRPSAPTIQRLLPYPLHRKSSTAPPCCSPSKAKCCKSNTRMPCAKPPVPCSPISGV